jgi:hypothetical protein
VIVLELNGTGQRGDHDAAALVGTPAQALSGFTFNGLDALAIGPFLATTQRSSVNQQEDA